MTTDTIVEDQVDVTPGDRGRELSVGEVQRRLNYAIRFSVYHLIRSGRLKGHKPKGRAWVVYEQDLEDYIKAKNAGSPAA